PLPGPLRRSPPLRPTCQAAPKPPDPRLRMMAATDPGLIRHVAMGVAMRRLFVPVALAGLFLLGRVSADTDPRFAPPPRAQLKEHHRTLHGETVADPYYWLREKGTPDVTTYLDAENAYTDLVTRRIQPFREKLYNEFVGRIQQTDLSVPYRRGNFYYYNRTEEGKQYPIVCRKRGSLDAAEEVMLDVNELAKGQKFF